MMLVTTPSGSSMDKMERAMSSTSIRYPPPSIALAGISRYNPRLPVRVPDVESLIPPIRSGRQGKQLQH